MVIPVVAAAAARVAATSAARAAATNAARTGAQATLRAGTQNAARTAITGTRGAAAGTAEGAEATAARNAGGYAQNAAAERNTLQLGERLPETRTVSGERAAQTASEEGQIQQQTEAEIQNRTRDRYQRRMESSQEVDEEQPVEKKKGMSFPTLAGMLIVAFIFDAIQTFTAFFVFGLVTAIVSYAVAFFSNILAWTIFIIWFSLCGLNIFSGRKMVVAVIGFIADTALAGIVPYWIVTVLVAYFDEKLEEHGLGLSKVVSMLK